MEDKHTSNRLKKLDAHEFINAAESAFNNKDLDAACAGYAQNATLESLTNGSCDSFSGIERISVAWKGIFKAMPHFILTKRIVLSSQQKIINEWEGTIDRKRKVQSRGIEIWTFNELGQVIHHKLYTFLKVYSADDLKGKLLFGLASPVLGWRLERERSKVNNQP